VTLPELETTKEWVAAPFTEMVPKNVSVTLVGVGVVGRLAIWSPPHATVVNKLAHTRRRTWERDINAPSFQTALAG
jgi:hypothetical protein